MLKQESRVQKPRRVSRVIQYEIDGEVVLYDPKRDRVHNLNSTAAFIWQLCDGSRTVDEVALDVAMHYGVDFAVTRVDVARILEQFERSHLLRHGVQVDV